MSRDYQLQPFRASIHLQIDYAHELNPQQHAAVTAPPGPSLVIAGAGSGKTRTLTYRVAYLLEQGIPAECVLLLTFTNKAAKEMMRRVADLLGQELASLWGGTFHAIGNRVLRQHANLLGYQRDFTIMDREDAKHLITNASRDGARYGAMYRVDTAGTQTRIAPSQFGAHGFRTIQQVVSADLTGQSNDHVRQLSQFPRDRQGEQFCSIIRTGF